MFDLNRLVRENIRNLVPYSSARDEFKGEAKVFLDANENSLGSPLTKWYNRYPDPLQLKLKEALGKVKGIPPANMFLGNGSDECIDLIFRSVCIPGQDNVIINPPTYGMYAVSAHINDVEVREAPLMPDFQLNLEKIESLIDVNTKIIWICSPNNPTGNAMLHQDIEMILNNFDGIVVIDEAYANFSRHRSFTMELEEYPNLVILQTLSKAWGLAGLRLGMAFASEQIINVLNKVKPPYNIGQATQDLVLKALEETEQVNDMILHLVRLRDDLAQNLLQLPVVEHIFPSDANFILVKMDDAKAAYKFLLGEGIVVRDRSNVILCDNCLRITVGSPDENEALFYAVVAYNATKIKR